MTTGITKTKTIEAPSRRVTRAVPANFGKSELSTFLDLGDQQVLATYAGLPRWVHALELIDEHLTMQAPTFFHEIDKARYTASKLFMRAFGTFRAACRLALAGQPYETTVLTRSIIESAVYAWACGYSQPHREAWEARNKGAKELKAAKDLFKWVTLGELLRGADPGIAERIQSFYKHTIEYGAHPNVAGVDLSVEIKHVDGERKEISTIFMHGEDAILMAILELLQTMSHVYGLLMLTIRDRLRILDLDRKVERQHAHVLRLIDEFQKQPAQR